MRPESIEFSDVFTKSFYLSFEDSQILSDISNKLKAQTQFPADYKLRPHLSLAYTSVSMDIRRALATKIDKFNQPITFDSVGALETPEQVICFEDIEKSKTIVNFSL